MSSHSQLTMFSVTLVFLLAAQGGQAFDAFDVFSSSDYNDTESRLLPGTSNKFTALADLPKYTTVISDANGITGMGVIINSYWIVSTQNAIGGKAATSLKVYANVLDMTALTATDVLLRRGKNMISQSSYDASKPILNVLVLLKVCPSFPAGYAATLTSTSLPLGTDTRMMKYKTNNLYYEEKKVGEICECETIPDFQTDVATSTHVCLQEHETIKGEASDLNGLTVTKKSDGSVIGFLVKEQGTDAGEVVINLSKFSTWITTNAVPAS